MVFLDSFLGILLSLVEDGGASEELSEFVSVESAFLELTNLLKEFLFASLALSLLVSIP